MMLNKYTKKVSTFEWSKTKEEKLIKQRKISFKDVTNAINQGKILADIKHPNVKKYPQQWTYVVEINGYAYVVPYVKKGKKIFLKTIYPSRQASKIYLKKL